MSFPFTAEQLLPDLKIDLGIGAQVFDARLKERINTAMERITAEGVTLTATSADKDLILMYAAWLWRCRITQEPMGRMLRLALNNRAIGEAAGEVQT